MMIEPIKFDLVTKEISLTRNEMPDGQFQIKPQITRNIGRIDEERVFTEIILKIENTEETAFPVNITVQIMGVFEQKNIPEASLDNFLEVQAVQLIFPYIRTIVSNLTASAFMPPLVLPVIDVPSIFPREEN